MSRKGNCLDNAPIESFFHLLKTECLNGFPQCKDIGEFKEITKNYVDWFNNRRISQKTKAKRNDTPISAKKDIMGDKTVRVRADLHHIIKIETAKNGGNVKEVMEIRLRSKLKSVLIVHYLKILYNRN